MAYMELFTERPIHCPFCGAGETQIQEDTLWNGNRSQVISARVMHWCQRMEGQPQRFLQTAGKTAVDAINAWNQRVNKQ